MNIIQVSPTLLRGPRPTCIEDYKQLRDAGVKRVLNLERGWFDFFHGQMNKEFVELVAVGIEPFHLQLGDVFAPSAEDLRSAVMMLKNSDAKTYVHCLHGVDRTGLVCALYRVHVQGWHIDDALLEMFKLGFHTFPYQWLGWVNRLVEAT